MFEVPLILWLSKKYRDKNIGKTNYLDSCLHRKYQSDDFIHSTLDLLNFDLEEYEANESIFSPEYIQSPRVHEANGERVNLDSIFQ